MHAKGVIASTARLPDRHDHLRFVPSRGSGLVPDRAGLFVLARALDLQWTAQRRRPSTSSRDRRCTKWPSTSSPTARARRFGDTFLDIATSTHSSTPVSHRRLARGSDRHWASTSSRRGSRRRHSSRRWRIDSSSRPRRSAHAVDHVSRTQRLSVGHRRLHRGEGGLLPCEHAKGRAGYLQPARARRASADGRDGALLPRTWTAARSRPAMLQTQEPYNTYLNTGLTPTPICAISTIAMRATLHPPAGRGSTSR